MSGLQTIRILVASMSPEERSTLRQFLLSFDSRGEKFDSKSVKLLDALSEKPETMDDRDIEFYIYGKRSAPAFSRLVIRFRDKLLESLLLDINIRRDRAYSEVFVHLFEVRKKINYAQILVGRGIYDFAFFLFDSVTETCRRYEFFDEALLAISLKMQVVALMQGYEELRKLQKLYDHYDYCRRAVLSAYLDYNYLVSNTEFQGHKDGYAEQLEDSLLRLRADINRTGSENISFYHNYIEAAYLQEMKQYREARKALRRQVALIQKSEAINVQYRLGNALVNLADNELYLGNFDRCIDYCQRAVLQLKVNTFNEFQCLETEFYGHFYAGKYATAELLLNELLDRDNDKSSRFRRGRRKYLLACTLFMQGEYRVVQDLLMELNAIESDREGWNVGIRVLSILNDIERSLHDLAGKKIENIRKHLRKLEQEKKLRQRDELIFQALRGLDKHSYHFLDTWHQMQPVFEKLRSDDPDYCWQIKSPEMIIFHEWFFSRLSKGRFVQKIPRMPEAPGSTLKQEERSG